MKGVHPQYILHAIPGPHYGSWLPAREARHNFEKLMEKKTFLEHQMQKNSLGSLDKKS